MTKPAETSDLEIADQDAICSTTTIAALLMLGAQFPHRQFNSAELCILSGVGRTAMSQIKNASDTPFSLGKCTLQRLAPLACETPRSEATVEAKPKPEAAMPRGFRKNISLGARSLRGWRHGALLATVRQLGVFARGKRSES